MQPNVLRRAGDLWELRFATDSFGVKDSRGIRYLAALLAAPGREIHTLDLVAMQVGDRAGDANSDAGPLLDAAAKEAYRRRLEDLRDELGEAEAFGDVRRAARAEEQIAFLAHELAGAVGLGGRDRRAAASAERARQAVSKAIRTAVSRIHEESPTLAEHLRASIRTGAFCCYEPIVPTTWDVSAG